MYGLKMIRDYISGAYIDDKTLDILEDSVQFMTQVIAITKDKNFYNLCGNKVKSDFNFVKFMIDEFKNDKEYLSLVADNFIAQSNNEIEKMDIILDMCGLIDDKEDFNYIKYCTQAYAFYSEKKLEIEICKQSNIEDKSLIGEGFIFVIEDYSSSLLIKDYFAKRLLFDIFEEYDIDLEKYLHQRYSSFEKVESKGMNNFLIEFVKQYDSVLASYLMIRPYLLNEYRKEMLRIKNNWRSYQKRVLEDKYDLLFETVSKYIDDYCLDISYGTMDIIMYFAKVYNVEAELKEFLGFEEELYNEMNDSYIDLEKMDVYSLKHFNLLRNMIKRILSQRVIEEPDVYNSSNNLIKINIKR